jgi:Na+-driven multidrug efflux pump
MPVNMGIIAIGNIFASGTPPSLSRKLGAKDFEGETDVGGLFYRFDYLVARPLFSFPRTDYAPHRYERIHLRRRGPISPCYQLRFYAGLMIALSGTLRSEGARSVMIGIGGGAIVKLHLTHLFIFVFHMGFAGPARPTVGANAYSCSFS